MCDTLRLVVALTVEMSFIVLHCVELITGISILFCFFDVDVDFKAQLGTRYKISKKRWVLSIGTKLY